MSKQIPIAGVPPPSMGKNCGQSPVNGCGTCASHTGETRHRGEVRDPLVGGPQRSTALSRDRGKPASRVWAVPVGCSIWTRHWTFRSRDLHPCLENGRLRCPARASLHFGRSASRECLYPAGRFASPTRRIVSNVLFGSSAWRKATKGDRARRKSRGSPSLAPACRGFGKAHRSGIDAALVEVAGRSLRRTWIARLPPTICGGASLGLLHNLGEG
jgi:hypothetical protein